MEQQICWEIRSHVVWKGNFKASSENEVICAAWNLHVSIFS
jgi:hypothetical protein